MCKINTSGYKRPDITNEPAHCWNLIRHQSLRRLSKVQVLSAFRYMSYKALSVGGVVRDDLNSIVWHENEAAQKTLAAKAREKAKKMKAKQAVSIKQAALR